MSVRGRLERSAYNTNASKGSAPDSHTPDDMTIRDETVENFNPDTTSENPSGTPGGGNTLTTVRPLLGR